MLSYDDKLQRSAIQAYGQKSAQVPKRMITTPIWANVGVDGPEATEKVGNGRVDKFIRTSVRDATTSNMRSKSLTFDVLAIIDPKTAPTTVAPTLQTNKFVKTCPSSAIFIPHTAGHRGCDKPERFEPMLIRLPSTTSSNNTKGAQSK